MKFLILAVTLAVASAGTVDISLKNKVKAGSVNEAIFELPQFTNQVNGNRALQALTGKAKVEALISTLKGLTTAAQAPYLQTLKSLGLTYQTNWISNVILVKGLTTQTLEKLATMEGDFIIREEGKVTIDPVSAPVPVEITQGPQWGVAMVRAPEAWAAGHQGNGTVAMIIDTGVNPNHVALSGPAYAGAWEDPYYQNTEPNDVHGHGSHCAGTILGRANGVGVAPLARWTACRGLNHQGSGSELNLNRCAEFALESDPMPTVVSNSWGGGSGSTWYNPAVNAWREAGIIPVFALGNGPSCRTANSPGDQTNLIGVGATTDTDVMASFSARGTTTDGRRKPEVSAPGQNIISCGTGANNYVSMSGTSMACPHVAGAVCILKGANPDWTYQDVLDALADFADHPTFSAVDRNCGLETPGQDFPNNAFGDGRINVYDSLMGAKKH